MVSIEYTFSDILVIVRGRDYSKGIVSAANGLRAI
jgi:hypothetical protein